MSDKRISQLVARVTLANNDVFPIVASGAATTNKVTLQTIDDYMQTNLDFGVTSVAMSVPTGLTVTGTPITSTGTFVVTFTAGYSIPTTAKQTEWDTAYTNRITSATAPLGIASNVISITQSGAASNGYLSSTDWNTFNNKQATITTGNLTEATSSVLTITGGTGSVLGSGTTIQVTQASGSQDGFLDSADWTTFNGKQNALSGTGIVKSTGGTITYLTDSTSNWDSAYNNSITGAAVTGTTTKTLTLTQQDAGTITATWTDDNTDAVTSVFGRTGAVVATSGDYNSSQVTENTNLYYTDTRARLALSGSTGISYNNTTGAISSTITQYTDALARAAISETVTGLDYNNTTGVLSTTAGYGIPTTASQATWDAAYNDKINSAAVTGTTTKTLTLNQQDGGTITATWTDDNTDAVTSVFGRTGAVVATSGDYTTTQVTEGTNLYYTQARFDTAFGLKSTTNLTEGTNLYFTNTRSRSSISLTTTGTSGAATYDSATGVLNIPSYIGGVTSVNTLTGAVTLTTSNIAEGTNLYYTDTRARLALSFVAGSGAYNSTTGVITIPTNNTQITNGSNYITLGSLSGSTGISYNSTTGAISSTITQYTDALARAAISLTTTGTSGAATYSGGVLNIPNYAPDLSGYVTLASAQTITGVKTFNNSGVGNIINATSSWTASVSNNPIITFGRAGSLVAGAIGYDDNQGAMYIGSTTAHNFIIKSGNTIAATFLNTGAATFNSTISASNLSGTNTGDQTLTGLGGVPTSRTLTINGSALDLSANRNWDIDYLNSLNTTILTQKGSGTLIHSYAITAGTSGLFTTSDNSNSVITINRHPDNYYSQLGFNSSGAIYYRSYNNEAINTSKAWVQVWHSGSLTNLNQLTNGPGYITGYTETDTLASVTGRGATTSTAITISNTLNVGSTLYANTGNEYLRNTAGAVNNSQFQTWFNSAGTRRGYFGYGSGGSNTLELNNESGGDVIFGGGSITANGSYFKMKGGGGSAEFIWYKDYSGSPSEPGFVINNRAGATTFSHNANGGGTSISGSFTAAGAISASNLSGTNTGDQSYVASAGKILGYQRGSFTVGGSTNTFYPVAFQIGSSSTGEQGISVLQIERGGYDEPGYSNYTFSTFHCRIRAKADGWGYGASYVQVEANAYTQPMLAEVAQQNQTSQLIVWLRGGCAYRWMDIEGSWTLNFANTSGGNYVTFSGAVTYSPTTTNTIGSNFKYQAGWGDNYISGTFTAGGDVVAYSDAKVKENIRPIDNVLERICNSRGVLYDRTDNESKDNIGFIAQELEKNFPELVTTDGDRKSVKYQNATAILFEAIKQQQKQIDELKKQLV